MQELPGAMRFMAQAKHIGKIVVSNREPVTVRAAVPAVASHPRRRDLPDYRRFGRRRFRGRPMAGGARRAQPCADGAPCAVA